MNRTEFIIATAIILFAAFMLGWFASWLINRLSRVTRAEMGELESMAQQLHEAEETRDRAVAELEEREADLVAKLSTAEAELGAVREELRETHAEIEELRDYIDRKLGKKV
jgi:septal ring factor EnvC (AmiA/AmiB activator)